VITADQLPGPGNVYCTVSGRSLLLVVVGELAAGLRVSRSSGSVMLAGGGTHSSVVWFAVRRPPVRSRRHA
jgi:hypothetical protein